MKPTHLLAASLALAGVWGMRGERHREQQPKAVSRSAEVNRKGRVTLYDCNGHTIGHGSLAKWEHLPIKEARNA